MNQKTIYSLCYALIFSLVLLAGFLGWTQLAFVLYPLGFLILFLYLQKGVPLIGRFHKRLLKGLVCACITAILFQLSQSYQAFQLLSLLGFFLTHLIYISAFYLDFKSAQELDKRGARLSIIGTSILFTAFYLLIRPDLGFYKLPAIAAIVIISLLLMMACFRNQRVNPSSFYLILGGVFVFVISDMGLMYAYFTHQLSNYSLAFPALYLIAHYLIITGGIKRVLIHQQTEV